MWYKICERLKARIKIDQIDRCRIGYHKVVKERLKKDGIIMQNYCVSNRKSCLIYDEEKHTCDKCKDNWLMQLELDSENNKMYGISEIYNPDNALRIFYFVKNYQFI